MKSKHRPPGLPPESPHPGRGVAPSHLLDHAEPPSNESLWSLPIQQLPPPPARLEQAAGDDSALAAVAAVVGAHLKRPKVDVDPGHVERQMRALRTTDGPRSPTPTLYRLLEVARRFGYFGNKKKIPAHVYLPPRMRTWRVHLSRTGPIAARMWIDEPFLAGTSSETIAGVPFFRDYCVSYPSYARAVVIVGHWFDPTDKTVDHLNTRYLIHAGWSNWGKNGLVWVSQRIAKHRFLEGFGVLAR